MDFQVQSHAAKVRWMQHHVQLPTIVTELLKEGEAGILDAITQEENTKHG